MKYGTLIFKEKEVKIILKMALDRKYSAQNQAQEGISLSELSEIAEGEISQKDLAASVQEYQERKSRRSQRLKGLTKMVVSIAGISLVGIGAYGITNLGLMALGARELKYVPATVLNEREERHQYNLTFKLKGKENDYFATIAPRGGPGGYNSSAFQALRGAIKEGSIIDIEQGALDRFKGISGMIVNDEIRVLKR